MLQESESDASLLIPVVYHPKNETFVIYSFFNVHIHQNRVNIVLK